MHSKQNYITRRLMQTARLLNWRDDVRVPKLKSVNLLRIDEFGSGRIKTGPNHLYIAKVGNIYYLGSFEKMLTGIRMDSCRLKFVPPGPDSQWKKLWEFIPERPSWRR